MTEKPLNPELVLFGNVKLPTIKWSDFSDKSEQTSTTIYLHDLINLVEDVYSKTRLNIINRNITFPEITIDELRSKNIFF